MIKKIFAAALVALAPVMAFGQKFGSLNSSDIIPVMPEYKAAQTELETLQKQYKEELDYMENEYQTKYENYSSQRETLPENIRQRREEELISLRQQAESYYNDIQVNLNNKSNELMEGINTKLLKAIKDVGEEGGFVCIFDLNAGVVPYVSTTLTTDVTDLVKGKLGLGK